MDSMLHTKPDNSGVHQIKIAHKTPYEKYNGVKKIANKMGWKCLFGRRLKIPKDCVNNYWCQTYQKVNKNNREDPDFADRLLKSFEINPCEFYLETVLPQLDKR